MPIKKIIQAFLLSLSCYFLEMNFLSGLFHSWLSLYLVISLILIFRKSQLWWPWIIFSLFFVWLGPGGWWWLSFGLTALFAWWLRQFFSGTSRFWELSIFGLATLILFILLLLAPNLLAMMFPKIAWPQIAWLPQWYLYFLAHLALLLIGYWLTSFAHER
ncbi:MAG: hypothetical protein NTV81_01355 [Candidatus Komeilibacteria bacterium]|nr:hypothetical protein [Candidatus Komeilibacteria bacterium]